MGARGWERVLGALPTAGHFLSATSQCTIPGASATGKPCSILPAVFPQPTRLTMAVGFEQGAAGRCNLSANQSGHEEPAGLLLNPWKDFT